MVSGTNKDGEVSNYTFNGLGVRVGTEVIVKDNTHGYTDFHCQTPTVLTGIDKPEVVLSDYVIDYTRLNIDQRVLVESETDGYDFRYTYGLDLVNVKATGEGTSWWAQSVKKCVYSDYVHTDRLGSVVNLTDQYGRVPAQIDYDDWGKVTAYQSLNISGGYRTVLPEITYAGHQYDDVLGMYYAKARMYDAENRRFASVDPVKGRITEPMTMVQYLYVVDDPLRWVDLLGLMHVADSFKGGGIPQKEPDPNHINDSAPQVDKPVATKPQTQNSPKASFGDSVSSYASGLLTAMADSVAPTVGMLLQGAADAYNYIVPYLAYTPTNGYDFYTPPPANAYDVYTPIINSGNIYDNVVGNAQRQSEIAAQNAANPGAFYAGRIDGDMLMLFSSIASASVGADMMSAGAGMTGAGLAAAPSGYGVAAAAGGAAISVAGGAVVAASAQVAATAAGNLHDDAQKKEYYDKAGCESKDATDKISMPTNNNQLKHIFDDKPGHLPVDTPENRALFESIANDPSCYLGPDEHGNVWHARMQSDGSQIWVRARGTVITDAGVNSTPQSYNPKTGLCRPERPW